MLKLFCSEYSSTTLKVRNIIDYFLLITYSSLHSEVKGKKPYLSNLSTCEASISIKSRCIII